MAGNGKPQGSKCTTLCVSVAYGYHKRPQRSLAVVGLARYTSGTKTIPTSLFSCLFLNSILLAQNYFMMVLVKLL